MQIYVVQRGDNVDEIARRFQMPVETLIYSNQIEYPYRLAVGQALLVNGGEALQRRELKVNGYAYPFIDRQVLSETLPYLTSLSIFSYGFTTEGELVPPAVDDGYLIARALAFGARPVLTLTPLGEDGRFSNNLVNALVENRQVQQRLIWKLGQLMQEKGYRGVDVDFEYVLAEDRVPFAEFVGRLTRVMNQFDYEVYVALAPKTSADQRGLLYEGIDYGLLGAAANRVFLMTYEWGYTYEPADRR